MVKAIADARDKHAKQEAITGASSGKVMIASALHYPAVNDHVVSLEFNCLPQEAYQALPPGSQKLLVFLNSFQWSLAPDNQQGVSWLELLVVFTAQGGLPTDLGISTDMGPRPSLRTVLMAFSRSVKVVVKMYLAQHSQVLFKPSKFPKLRCRSIGFSNHCACIAALPSLTSDQALHVTQSLVSLRHTFTRNSEQLFRQDALQLPPRKFSYRGAVPDKWSNLQSFDSSVQLTPTRIGEWLTSISQPEVSSITTLLLQCPVCHSPKECINKILLKGTTWCSIVCPQQRCRRVRSSAKWLCVCGKPWYLCNVHGPIGHSAGKAKQRCNSHCNHQPSFAPELPMPVEPVPKRRKVGESNGLSNRQRPSKRKSSLQGPLPKRRKELDAEAIASVKRLREARAQVTDPGTGADHNL